jgi:hypothetical protein
MAYDLFSEPALDDVFGFIHEALTCGCFEKIDMANEELKELVGRLDEARPRRRSSVRRWKNMRKVKSFKVGRGKKLRKANKLYVAARIGAVYNRHRR